MSKNRPISAERRFALMCADYGVACNKAEEDINGWDYIVELPADFSRLPSDMARGPQACLVQVKSALDRHTKIKLSNALRFAQSALPCFIVLFSKGKGDSPESIYLLHFWDALIGRTLKRVREAERDNKDLHKVMIALKFQSKNKVDDLLGAIKREVGFVGHDYEGEKRKRYKSIGFEGPSIVGSFLLAEGTTIDDILEHQLGNKESLDISKFVAHSNRFGIKSQVPLIEVSKGVLKIGPAQSPDCGIVLTANDTGEQLRLTGRLTVPNFPGLTEEKRKIKIAAGPLEMIIGPLENGTVNFINSHSEEKTFSELAMFASLRRLFSLGEVDCKITFQEQLILAASIKLDMPQAESFWIHLESFLNIVVRSLPEQAHNTLTTSIDKLVSEIRRIEKFGELINGDSFHVNATIDPVGAVESGPVFAFYKCQLAFGGYELIAFVLRSGDGVFERSNFRGDLSKVVQKTFLALKQTDSTLTAINMEYDRLAKLADRVAGLRPIFQFPGDAMTVVKGRN